MDLMLPQVQAPEALPPLPRHIGQNPAPELPPRPPSALAPGVSRRTLQSCSRLCLQEVAVHLQSAESLCLPLHSVHGGQLQLTAA